jgi:hypothetical protein
MKVLVADSSKDRPRRIKALGCEVLYEPDAKATL